MRMMMRMRTGSVVVLVTGIRVRLQGVAGVLVAVAGGGLLAVGLGHRGRDG